MFCYLSFWFSIYYLNSQKNLFLLAIMISIEGIVFYFNHLTCIFLAMVFLHAKILWSVFSNYLFFFFFRVCVCVWVMTRIYGIEAATKTDYQRMFNIFFHGVHLHSLYSKATWYRLEVSHQFVGNIMGRQSYGTSRLFIIYDVSLFILPVFFWRSRTSIFVSFETDFIGTMN